MKYTIIAAASLGQTTFNGKDGNPITLDKVMLTLTDDKGATVAAEMNQKPGKPLPVAGETIEGVVEATKYGNKFKREQQGGGGFGGGRGRSPEERDEIMRQNALTNAVAYVTAKAELMAKLVTDEKGMRKAIDYLSGKQIIQVATYFHRYSKGAVTVVTESKGESEETTPIGTTAEGDPAPSLAENFKKVTGDAEPPAPPEVDLEDIPF